MKLIDAFHQAMRECGISDEEIKYRDAQADLSLTFGGKDVDIPPGCEQKTIDMFKKLHHGVMSMTEEQKLKLRGSLDRITAKINRSN